MNDRMYAWRAYTKAWKITLMFEHRTDGDVDANDLNRKWKRGTMWTYLMRRKWSRISC